MFLDLVLSVCGIWIWFGGEFRGVVVVVRDAEMVVGCWYCDEVVMVVAGSDEVVVGVGVTVLRC
jgi:hypothetical protein